MLIICTVNLFEIMVNNSDPKGLSHSGLVVHLTIAMVAFSP